MHHRLPQQQQQGAHLARLAHGASLYYRNQDQQPAVIRRNRRVSTESYSVNRLIYQQKGDSINRITYQQKKSDLFNRLVIAWMLW